MPYTQPVIEILNELKAEPGKKNKLAILQKHRNHKALELSFKYALDPMINYGIKKIPEYVSNPGGGTGLEKCIYSLKALTERQVTGHKAINWLANTLEGLQDIDAEVFERIITGKLDCGVSGKTANKIWPDLIKEFNVSKAQTMSEKALKHIVWPAYVQTKEDGARVNIPVRNGKVEFLSSSGKEIDTLGFMHKEMIELAHGQDLMFDGEIRVLDKNGKYLPRKKGNGLVNKGIKGTIKQEEVEKFIFVIFDVIPGENFRNQSESKTPYYMSLDYLKTNIPKLGTDNIRLIKSQLVSSMYEVEQIYNKLVKSGEEGIILKNKNFYWEPKRSKHQIKMKEEKESELIISAVVEGLGKHSGKLGAFICESSDGLLSVSVGGGYSDEERDLYFSDNMIGKIITVRFNEVIDRDGGKKSMFLPRCIELRNDKTEADPLHVIEKQ